MSERNAIKAEWELALTGTVVQVKSNPGRSASDCDVITLVYDTGREVELSSGCGPYGLQLGFEVKDAPERPPDHTSGETF